MPVSTPKAVPGQSSSGRQLKPSQRATDGGYVKETTKKRQARLQKEAASQAEAELGSEPEYNPQGEPTPRAPTKWQSPIPTGHVQVDRSRRNAARSEWLVAAICYRDGEDYEAEVASGEMALSDLEKIWRGDSIGDDDGPSGHATSASVEVNVGLPTDRIIFGRQLDVLKTTKAKKSRPLPPQAAETQVSTPSAADAPARFSPLQAPLSSKAAGKKRARSPETNPRTPAPPAKVARLVQEHPHRSSQRRTITPEQVPAPRQPFATLFSQPVYPKRSSGVASASSARQSKTQGLRLYTGPSHATASQPCSHVRLARHSSALPGPPPHPSTPDHDQPHEGDTDALNAGSASPRARTPMHEPRPDTSTRRSGENNVAGKPNLAPNRPIIHQGVPRQAVQPRAITVPRVPRQNPGRVLEPDQRTAQRLPLARGEPPRNPQALAHHIDDDDDPNPMIDEFGDEAQDVRPEQPQDPNKPVLRLFYPLELRYLVRAVSERVVARMLADGTYTDVLLADDKNPNYVSLLEEIAGEEWLAECERCPLRHEYDLGLIHIKYFRGLITSWRARIKERILVEFRSRFSLGKGRQQTCKRANKLLPDAFHSDQESNTHGLFKSDVVSECVRLAVYFNKQCFGVRFPEYFTPIPLGLIGLVTTIANHVISLFESGTFRPRSLNVREQAPMFAYYLDYLQDMEETRSQRLENIQLKIQDYCIGSLPKAVVLHAPPPREKREMTPDSPRRYEPIHLENEGSDEDEDMGDEDEDKDMGDAPGP